MSEKSILPPAWFLDAPDEARQLRKPLFAAWLSEIGIAPVTQMAKDLGTTKQNLHQIMNNPSRKVPPATAHALVKDYLVGDVDPLEVLLKDGNAPVRLLHALGWEHFNSFRQYLKTLDLC